MPGKTPGDELSQYCSKCKAWSGRLSDARAKAPTQDAQRLAFGRALRYAPHSPIVLLPAGLVQLRGLRVGRRRTVGVCAPHPLALRGLGTLVTCRRCDCTIKSDSKAQHIAAMNN